MAANWLSRHGMSAHWMSAPWNRLGDSRLSESRLGGMTPVKVDNDVFKMEMFYFRTAYSKSAQNCP